MQLNDYTIINSTRKFLVIVLKFNLTSINIVTYIDWENSQNIFRKEKMTRCIWNRYMNSNIYTNTFSIDTLHTYTADNKRHYTNIALIYIQFI